ncbi:MAG: alpha/beta hydrolase [Chloroflexi bacterium]|nr:alpha/beta hydrolase [Chloroflexota bacterium]
MIKLILKIIFYGFIAACLAIVVALSVLMIDEYIDFTEPYVATKKWSLPTSDRTDPAPTEELEIRPIEWQACDDDVVTESGFECSTVYVPLDYTDPTGTKLEIAVIRYKATAERRGAIFYNPGGPGGSGFDTVAQIGSYYVDELGLSEYDFVGFDPRGVDRSNGLKCQSDDEIDKYQYGDSSPDTSDEKEFHYKSYESFITGCWDKYRNTLRHYSTINTARDMDVIRAAMGDAQISYLGVSYGTYLGAVYAHEFPERVRAMVLDAAYEPNGDSVEEQYLTQMIGFEEALNNWIAWCTATPACAFRAEDVGARWDALYEQYNQYPVTASDGRVTYQSVIMRATKSALYSDTMWPTLANALADAERNNVLGVWKLVDGYNERNQSGVYRSLIHAFEIISCASGIDRERVEDPEALIAKMRQVAPRMSIDWEADDLDNGSQCDDLMSPQPVANVGNPGNAPILVIGGEHDPATPLRWSEKMHDQMGPNAALLIYGGEGHGQVLSSTCVNQAASNTLKELTLPADNTRCEAQSTAVEPGWWANVPPPQGDEQFLQRDQITAVIDIAQEEYATGMTMPGTTEEILASIQQRLELRGFLLIDKVEINEHGAHSVAYFIEGVTLRVMVIGNETMSRSAWDGWRELVPANHGVVIFMTES